MKLYHQTSYDQAITILASGFTENAGLYGTTEEFSGVFVSDRVLKCNDGLPADADVLLEIDLALPADAIDDYEWIEPGIVYRCWFIPARVLNVAKTVSNSPFESKFVEN
jgi:hypothetical protein